MHAKQLSEVLQSIGILKGIRANVTSDIVAAGNVVLTSHANYFIAVNAGKIEIENYIFFVISPLSPIAQILLNRKKGEKLSFNNQEITILDIL